MLDITGDAAAWIVGAAALLEAIYKNSSLGYGIVVIATVVGKHIACIAVLS